MEHADEPDVPAGSGGADGLHHRLLGADRLDDRVRADPIGEVLDPRHALVTAFDHDVGRAEFARELLPRLVTAHRDDPLGAHLLGGEHAEQANGAVTDDHDGRAWLHVRRVGGEPAGAQDIRRGEQAGDQVVRGKARCRHQRAVREWHAQQGRLRAAHKFPLHTG